MKNTNVAILPIALQLCLDDVAWHQGHDLRFKGQASRSGIPRYHSPLDYKVIDELGRALDMKILCPLCLGDWDKDNFLRGEVGVTHNPYGWDRASEIDYDYAAACFDALNGAEYLEFAYHGLLHGRYDERGKLLTETEYFELTRDEEGKRLIIPDKADVIRRLDLFDKIYKSWGFSQKIRSFVAPCSLFDTRIDDLANIIAPEIASRGVKYWANAGVPGDRPMLRFGDIVCMRKGGTINGKAIPWDAYDVDPRYLDHYVPAGESTVSGVMGMHWTNFLRFNPENNEEKLNEWIAYFKGEAEIFGTMLSRDVAHSANQLFYNEYARLSQSEDGVTVDIAKVIENAPAWLEKTFYISIVNEKTPIACEGGSIELYECHKSFKNYKVTHTESTVKITLK